MRRPVATGHLTVNCTLQRSMTHHAHIGRPHHAPTRGRLTLRPSSPSPRQAAQTSLRAIAAALNEPSIPTQPVPAKWQASQVRRVLARLALRQTAATT
jgi:hypothetical protein